MGAMHSPATDETRTLSEKERQRQSALRVAAAFLLANAALLALSSILVALLGEPTSPTVLFLIWVDVWIGVKLWQGRSRRWVGWAIGRAILGFLFSGIPLLIQGQVAGFVALAAFCGALVLALTGKGNRSRTLIAAGLFAGYVGVMLGALVNWFVQAIV